MGEEDIEKMVRDAEANADADSKRRRSIESKKEIDSLIYTTEKSLKDNGDKLDDETKKEVETAIEEAKKAEDSDDPDEINAKKEALSQASMKIGQAMYTSDAAGGEEGGEKKEGEDTQEAEFTEKKTDDEKDK